MSNTRTSRKTTKFLLKHYENMSIQEKYNLLLTHKLNIDSLSTTVSLNTLEIILTNLFNKMNIVKDTVTPEFQANIKKKILKDKRIISNNNIQNTKSLKILDPVSTGKEKDFKPFWTNSSKEMSSKLWLPTRTDCQDLDMTCYNGSQRNLIAPSWFSMKVQHPIRKLNYQTISCPSSITSQPRIMGLGLPETESKDLLRAKKIKLYPTTQQKQQLCKWFGANRWVYNQCNNYIKQLRIEKNNQIPRDKILRDKFVSGTSIKDFTNGTPYDIRDGGMRDVLKNLRSNLSKVKKKSITHFDLKFKKLKDSIQSISVPHKFYNTSKDYSILSEIKKSENISADEVRHDFRILKDINGDYWMCLPVERNYKGDRQANVINDNRVNHLISLDPGVRTFMVGYDPNRQNVIHIGESCIQHIQRLCKRLDNLIATQNQSKNRKKVRLRKAIRSLRKRIKNSIKDMHCKTSNFLCENYNMIFLPTFETQKMVSNLHSKVARNMLNLSHYSFKMILIRKCQETNTALRIVTEEFTSKTCGRCGELNNELKNSKEFKCPNKECCIEIDRDVNASRNILIKNLEA